MWTGIFAKRSVWTLKCFYEDTVKKMHFQKYPDTCGRGLNEERLVISFNGIGCPESDPAFDQMLKIPVE